MGNQNGNGRLMTKVNFETPLTERIPYLHQLSLRTGMGPNIITSRKIGWQDPRVGLGVGDLVARP